MVVEREDALLRAVAAVRLLVLALDDREGLHDVGDRIARGGQRLQQFGRCRARPFFGSAEVEVEERGVELAADFEAALGVVAEHSSVALGPEVLRERVHVVGGGGEFEDARSDQSQESRGVSERRGGKQRKLSDQIIGEMSTADLLPR